jgi:hypothetical protein
MVAESRPNAHDLADVAPDVVGWSGRRVQKGGMVLDGPGVQTIPGEPRRPRLVVGDEGSSTSVRVCSCAVAVAGAAEPWATRRCAPFPAPAAMGWITEAAPCIPGVC